MPPFILPCRALRGDAVDISPGTADLKNSQRLAAREGVFVPGAGAFPGPGREDGVQGFPASTSSTATASCITWSTALAAGEIARILKPGGKAVFIEPLAYNPVIWVYRHLAAGVRTESEEPMTYLKFRAMAGYFQQLPAGCEVQSL